MWIRSLLNALASSIRRDLLTDNLDPIHVGGAGKRHGQRGGTCTASAAMGWATRTDRAERAMEPLYSLPATCRGTTALRAGWSSASPRLGRPRYLRRKPA